MPRSVLTCLYAVAVLLAPAMVAAPARAEMTEADKVGMHAFAACLDETGNDEDTCLEKLARYAWYPRDDAACEAVAARVRAVLTNSAQVDWLDLFYNERCARLGLPHDREAAKVGDKLDPKSAYGACMRGDLNMIQCEESLGRYVFYPWYEGMCQSLSHLQSVYVEAGWGWSLRGLFMNERCRRLGKQYFDPEL